MGTAAERYGCGRRKPLGAGLGARDQTGAVQDSERHAAPRKEKTVPEVVPGLTSTVKLEKRLTRRDSAVSGVDNLRRRHRAGRSTALVRDAGRVPAQARDSHRPDNRTAPGRARRSLSYGGSLVAGVYGRSHGKLSKGASVGFAAQRTRWNSCGAEVGKPSEAISLDAYAANS
jgi:hypothetical protein